MPVVFDVINGIADEKVEPVTADFFCNRLAAKWPDIKQ